MKYVLCNDISKFNLILLRFGVAVGQTTISSGLILSVPWTSSSLTLMVFGLTDSEHHKLFIRLLHFFVQGAECQSFI